MTLSFVFLANLDLVLKAGTEIRISEKRCLEIIRKVEETCQKNLPKCNFLTSKQKKG